MFDNAVPDGTAALSDPAPGLDAPPPVPLERLEAQICELAGHLAAATCRFLILLGDFDAREGWASWDMSSCAVWLSWKCQLSSGTAREHVRVARALRRLPVIRAEFGAGRFSYAKVRALTRIATPQTEADLADLAGPMTANQLERFARAHRQVSSVDDQAARLRRRLAFRLEDDGSLSGTFHLPPLAGATLLKALRAVLTDDQQDPHPAPDSQPDPPGVSAETPPAVPLADPTSSNLADALLVIAESFLSHKAATADDPDVYQVVVHLGPDALGVSAETPIPPANPLLPGHPADPARCHVEDGPAISAATAQRIACSATWTWMLHDSAGKLLDLGRRRRRPSSALRRAARDRDSGRCRFPGCDSRRVDLHHIQYWSNGGQTKLDNLIGLCRRHHQAVHDRGYLIALTSNGTFAFYDADGSIVPSSPPLPDAPGSIEGDHDAGITPETIIPAWYGERLDLDHAIYVCFANAALAAKTQAAAEAEANHEAATLPAGESPLKAGPPRSPERPIIATPADVRLLSQPFAWTSVPPRWTSG